MIIFAPKETDSSETRAALTPTTVKRLVDIGLEVEVESGIGAGCDHSDIEYSESGAKIVKCCGVISKVILPLCCDKKSISCLVVT